MPHEEVRSPSLEDLEGRTLPSIVVNAGPAQNVNAGDLVNFSGSFTEPGGTAGASCAWDFDYDGTTFNPGQADTPTPQHVFTTPGAYTVALQVTDAAGGVGLGTTTVTVGAATGLVVDLGPDQTVRQGSSVTFSAAWSDPSGTPPYPPTVMGWNFGDGTTAGGDGTLTATHQFLQPGVHEVTAQVYDGAGAYDGVEYVNVLAVPPQVSAGTNQTVAAGTPLTFSGTLSDVYPSGYPYINWDFEYDGTFQADGSASQSLTPTHTYTAPGVYVAALQVTDPDGLSSLATALVTVTDAAPVAVNDAYSVPLESTLTVSSPSAGVLANDSDPQGYQLSVVSHTAPADGTLNLKADGTFAYTPNPGFVGTDSFGYTASDGALQANATVTLNVTGQAPPEAVYTVTTGLAANDGATGSLRAAISSVNAGTSNGITFAIGTVGQVATINLDPNQGPLPAIRAAATIDGYSQGGTDAQGKETPGVYVELNGTDINGDGLTSASSYTSRGHV